MARLEPQWLVEKETMTDLGFLRTLQEHGHEGCFFDSAGSLHLLGFWTRGDETGSDWTVLQAATRSSGQMGRDLYRWMGY